MPGGPEPDEGQAGAGEVVTSCVQTCRGLGRTMPSGSGIPQEGHRSGEDTAGSAPDCGLRDRGLRGKRRDVGRVMAPRIPSGRGSCIARAILIRDDGGRIEAR